MLREIKGRNPQPSTAIFDSRTMQSGPESGTRTSYDGHKRRKGSKVHLVVDSLRQLLAAVVTPADPQRAFGSEQERAQVDALAVKVQAATGESIEAAFVDQGYTSDAGATDAVFRGIGLEVVKLPTSKDGSVLLPRRWVV